MSEEVMIKVEQLSTAVAVPVLDGNVLEVHAIVMLAGQVRTGGALSSTVIVWLHVLEFPHASVTCHVRVIVLSCGHEPAVITLEKENVNVEQLSVAVGFPVVAGSVLDVQEIVTLTGQVMIGDTLSMMVMV